MDAAKNPKKDPTGHCPDSVNDPNRNEWEFVEGLGCFYFDGGDYGCKGSWSQSVNFCKRLAKHSKLIEVTIAGVDQSTKTEKDLFNHIKKYALNTEPYEKRNSTFGESMNNFMKFHQYMRSIGNRKGTRMLPDRQTRDSGPWLGANDIALEGSWIWDQTNQLLAEQPQDIFKQFINDDIGPMPGPFPGEDCMELFSSDGTVNDLNCDFWRLNPLCHIPYNNVEHDECPEGWDKLPPFGCYFLIEVPMTWEDSFKHCQKFHKGAYLAEPTTSDALMALSKRYGNKNNTMSRHTRASGPWIGATDRETEDRWVWATSGKAVLASQLGPNSEVWADDEGPTYGEDCMEIFNGDGFVNDLNCTYWQLSHLCEVPIKKVPGEWEKLLWV